MSIITLTTDFGTADGYVGIMKGVILGIAPRVRLVDLSHDIPPQDVRRAAYMLRQAAPYFPPDTIHLAVVDPGVGGSRRALLVETPRARYVGPDNGLFTYALQEDGARAYALERPGYWLQVVSRTFHGRDVFAPVAAHLASGSLTPCDLGRPVSDAVRLAASEPVRHPDGHLSGHVLYADRFGNLVTDVPAAWVGLGAWRCQVAGRDCGSLAATYGDVAPGALLALVGSSGTVEVAVRGGSAAQALAVTAGAPVLLYPAG